MSKRAFRDGNERALKHFAAVRTQREADAKKIKDGLRLELAQQMAQEQQVQQEKELQLKKELQEQEAALVAKHRDYVEEMERIHMRSIQLGIDMQAQFATQLKANSDAIQNLTHMVQTLSEEKTSTTISTPTAISAPLSTLSTCSGLSIISGISTVPGTPGKPEGSGTPSMSQSLDSIIGDMTAQEQKAGVPPTGDMAPVASLD